MSIGIAVFPAYCQFFQEGNKLVGTGASPVTPYGSQGASVALSADGNTALVGGPGDDAAWVFARLDGGWSQQGAKLVPNDETGRASFGNSVALSSDGNTALIGGPLDNGWEGAAWVFTRLNGVWSQQGGKLIGSGISGTAGPLQGASVALSSDASTALVGGPGDNSYLGATWVFTHSGSTWDQQGSKLVGSGALGLSGNQGTSVALSSDGNTALIGGPDDYGQEGAAWVFTRSGGVWSQQGEKLVGSGAFGTGANQGRSVALSGDATTALLGGPTDDSYVGAVWVFVLSDGVWTQQGSKLIGGGYTSAQPWEGSSTALSSDGNIALIGGPSDNDSLGAVWVFRRSAGSWSQQGDKLVGSDAIGSSGQGLSVALSSTGNTLLFGGPDDYNGVGAAWIFAVPTLTVSAPASATPGVPFNISVTAQDSAGAIVTGYSDSVQFTSSDGSAILPANSTLTNGSGSFQVTLRTAGNQTLTVTDTIYANLPVTSGSIAVSPPLPPTISTSFGMPSIPLNGYTTLGFSLNNSNAAISLTGVGFSDTLPAGLLVSSPGALTGTCGGGTITAAPGGASVSLTGATLAGGAACTFLLNVTGTTAGAKANVTSEVISNEGGAGNGAAANLAVVAPPSLRVSFRQSGIALNGVTSLNYTIYNPAANTVPLTGVGLTDAFPPGLSVASPNGLSNTCGGGVTATPGSGSVNLSGATLAAGMSCALAVDVTVTTTSILTSGLATVVSANGGTSSATSATLSVLVPTTLKAVPDGLGIQIDGTTYTAGVTLQLALSSSHTISVVTPQAGTAGTRYLFDNWSDGGAISHTISVTASPATYTAAFTTQYQLTLAVTPAGSGTVTPVSGGFYDAGASVTLTAAANAGYAFNSWTGPANPPGSATAAVVMNAPESIVASFGSPQVSSMLNGASFQPGQAAPDTILSLFGTGLGCTSAPQVLVNGTQTQILFASNAQINFATPASLGGAGNAGVQVVCNGVSLHAGMLALSPADPAIFTQKQNGTGQGAILNQNYSANGAQSPAAVGSYISVYVTGFGELGPAGADGLQRLTLPVTASIGGVAAQVTYAGEAPGYTSGLQQINIVIPENAAVGLAVPIQLVVNGERTQSGVTMCIQ